MLLGIVSDTHDRLERTTRAVALLCQKGATNLIHCGDLTGPQIVHACAALPCTYVFGNNDYRVNELRQAIEETGGQNLEQGGLLTMHGKRIGVTHGHHAQTFLRLVADEPDYLLFGHSHFPLDDRDGRTRHINPGALHRAASYTVALLDLERDLLEFLTVSA